MPRSPFVVAAALTAAALTTAVRLTLDPEPFADDAGALLAAGYVVLAVVAVAGVLLARARWSRYLGIGLGALGLGIGATMPLDALGIAAMALAGAASAGSAGPWLPAGWLRHRPHADGPPPAAVAVVLTLLTLPVAVALARPGGITPPDWALVGCGVALAFGVARAMAPALWLTRLGIGPLGIALGIAGGLPGGLVAASIAVAATAAAWRPEVRLSVTPLAPLRSPGVPFPPELVPAEVLEAAGYDERGRPKDHP